jgi:hypothetical protein
MRLKTNRDSIQFHRRFNRVPQLKPPFSGSHKMTVWRFQHLTDTLHELTVKINCNVMPNLRTDAIQSDSKHALHRNRARIKARHAQRRFQPETSPMGDGL